jgi:hypothetical protein
MSLLPYGPKGQYLIYHVSHAVFARQDAPLMNPAWLDAQTAPFASTDRQPWLDRYLDGCCEYLPDLRGGRLKGFLQGPRMVLADREDTDARPSFVTLHEPGYMSVFSGKIDHCFWIAEEVKDRLTSASERAEKAGRHSPHLSAK